MVSPIPLEYTNNKRIKRKNPGISTGVFKFKRLIWFILTCECEP